MDTPEFEEEVIFIPDSKDDPKAFVQVATITNESERIVRVVAKGLHSLTIEVMYLMPGAYQWHNEHVHIGIDELLTMAKAVEVYEVERKKQEEEENK